jgi:hypothetical protein
MASTISPIPKTPAWIVNSLIGGFVFLACWGISIAYWRSTRSAPGTGEFAAFLFAIPLALTCVAWLGVRLILPRIAASIQEPVPAKPAAAPPAPPISMPLAVLASALRSPHGASAEELATAIAGGKARADLDRELIDEDGFPVMTARSDDADDAALQEEIAAWLAHHGMADMQFSDAQWRALILASAVTGDLTLSAIGAFAGIEGALPMLQLVPLLPLDWHADQRQAAAAWLRHMVERSGWAPDSLAIPAEAPANAGGPAPSTVFSRLARDTLQKAQPLAALVVACASHIDQETVDKWAAEGKLFTSARPQGLTPGEGAAGLVLADLAQAHARQLTDFVVLDPVEEAQHGVSADDMKRVDPNVLEELTKRAIKRRNIDFTDVVMIVADTGHRSSRVLELMGYASVTMPQLDEAGDIVCVGVACGSSGTVPFITALALARHYVLERFGPVVCVSNEDAQLRQAALVQQDGVVPG